ncbi:MAG: hypothetical protein ACP5R5_07335 [Armatimonadota bacterium]
MPTQAKMVYLSADGVGQLSEETTDDVVVKLWVSRVNPEQFLDDLSRVSFPRRAGPANQRPTDLVTEYSPPTVLVEVLDAQGRTRSWEGDPGHMPAELAAAVEKARRLIKSGSGFAADQGTRYIRAAVLSPHAAEDMKEAGVLKQVTASDLEKAPLVGRAICHPRMLVCVDAADNPFGSLGAFSRGRSVALNTDNHAFQVRNLEKSHPSRPRKEINGG